jgi:hypothetical protein
VHLGWGQAKFVRVGRAGVTNTLQDVVQFLVVANQLQQGLVASSGIADTKEVFGSRIE